MPSRAEWEGLVSETARGLGARDVQGFLDVDFRRAVRVFLAEHREELDAEPVRWKRALRSANALLYGMVRRLTPVRRLLFALALLFSLLGFLVPRDADGGEGHRFGLALLSILVLLVLLGLELVDKLHFRDELLMARDLQADLVPSTLPESPVWALAGFNQVANTVGGDLYDFVPLPDGRLAVLFGDASGHGMAAGLLMAVTRSAFRTQVATDPAPGPVASALNRILCRTGPGGSAGSRAFFAGIVLLLAPDGRWSAVVAGHPPALRLGPDGRVRERIGAGAYPFGIRERVEWPVLEGTLGADETLLFHSDGLPEARSASGEEFGDSRIEEAAARAIASPSLLVSTLAAELRRFLGIEPPDDDVSIAAIRRKIAGA